jgi:CRP-like cAMP-binding protein
VGSSARLENGSSGSATSSNDLNRQIPRVELGRCGTAVRFTADVPTASPSDLAIVPLFRSLSDSELAEIAGWFEAKEVAKGVRLAGEGVTGHSFFIIGEGEAAVTAGGRDVALLGPGDFFGEMALLGHGRRRATVTTTSPTRVFVLFGDDFRRLQAQHPDIAGRLVAVMEERLEQL